MLRRDRLPGRRMSLQVHVLYMPYPIVVFSCVQLLEGEEKGRIPEENDRAGEGRKHSRASPAPHSTYIGTGIVWGRYLLTVYYVHTVPCTQYLSLLVSRVEAHVLARCT